MARVISYNWHLEIPAPNGGTIHPVEIGEFGPGEEGRIEVADGTRKYKIADQIFSVDEIPVTINMKKDRYEYDIMEAWAERLDSDEGQKDIYLHMTDSAGVSQLIFLLGNCQCARAKFTPFNRKSKDELRSRYILIPEEVEEV